MKTRKNRVCSLLLGAILLFSIMMPGLTVLADEAPPDVTHYISNLTEASAKVGWGSLMKDKGLEDLPICLLDGDKNPVTYEKGLVAHAASEVIYDLDGMGAKQFQSYIGVNYTKEGSCGFYVYADDTLLYEKALLRHGDSQEYIDVLLPEGTRYLKLVTTDGGDGMNSDHSVWADTKLICDGLVQSQLQSIYTVADKAVLAVGEETALTVMGRMKSGAEKQLAQQEITFESQNTEVATVTQDGVVTAVAEGTAAILCTANTEGKEFTAWFNMVVLDDQVQDSWTLASPSQNNEIQFILQDNGTLVYTAKHEGEMLADASPTGIKTSLGDFTSGLTFAGKSEQVVDENYELIGAKFSDVHNYGNELTLNFVKNGIIFQVVARAYDDGVAFRYGVLAQSGVALDIYSEHTGVQLPAGTTTWVTNYTGDHEQLPEQKGATELDGRYTMPMLYKTQAGTYGLVSEAALSTEYCGAELKGNTTGLVDIQFCNEQSGSIKTTAPFQSPWRFIVMGSPADINLTLMPENLSPPCEVEDTSWIEPGVTAWTWLNGGGTRNYDVYVQYIDLASTMGWEYLLLDEGWQPDAPSGSGLRYQGYHEWTEKLIDYANSKNVGLLVWANHSDLKDAEYVDKLFAEWHEMGFKGVKPDFFNSQNQECMKQYDMLMKLSAKHQLALNPHGANKTTGERRTYPQLLSREGIFGAEQDPYRPKGLVAQYNCLVPFIRNAVGPADYTPMFSKWRSSSEYDLYSLAHMAALTVVYESGIQCLSDSDSAYLNSPARDFFQKLPASWDESVMLAGDPGDYVNIARRSGENWYVGGIGYSARDAQVDLSFLQSGKTYYASIYKDGDNTEEIVAEYRTVTSADTLTVPMLKTGGFAIKIVAENPGLPTAITLSDSVIDLKEGESAVITAEIEPAEMQNRVLVWETADPAIASVTNGKVTGLREGITTLTAQCVNPFTGEVVAASAKVRVRPPAYRLTDQWEILANSPTHWTVNHETSATILSEAGEFHSTIGTAKNIFLTPSAGNFEATVLLDFAPSSDFRTAGLIVYGANNAMFNVVRRSHSMFNTEGDIFAITQSQSGQFREDYINDPSDDAPVYLKLVRSGTTFTGYYRFPHEQEWTEIGSFTNSGLAAEDLKIGLYCVNGDGKSGETPATFDNFTLNGEITPFGTKTVDKIGLKDLYEENKDRPNDDYTSDSWQAFQLALENAKAVLDDGSVNQSQIDAAAEQLQTAVDWLVKNSDIPVESVKINLGVLTNLKYNKPLELKVTINPENATNKVLKWQSSNTNVLVVDENGVVTGLKPGTARVTVTAQGGVSHTVTIRVTA